MIRHEHRVRPRDRPRSNVAYEVTKRISGGDYRYRVEGYRDPDTGRQRSRWQYLGRVVDGMTVTPPVRRGDRVTQDKIVVSTAELLESRDASRVTVAVIAKHAGISQATFYRYFHDRKGAFTAALSYLCDLRSARCRLLRILRSAHVPRNHAASSPGSNRCFVRCYGNERFAGRSAPATEVRPKRKSSAR